MASPFVFLSNLGDLKLSRVPLLWLRCYGYTYMGVDTKLSPRGMLPDKGPWLDESLPWWPSEPSLFRTGGAPPFRASVASSSSIWKKVNKVMFTTFYQEKSTKLNSETVQIFIFIYVFFFKFNHLKNSNVLVVSVGNKHLLQ